MPIDAHLDESNGKESAPDLCLISLKYLHQFSSMLRSMYRMPACPLFSAHKLRHTTRVIDTSHLIDTGAVGDRELPIVITLEQMDRPNKILHIWFLLIDEFLQSVQKCDQKHCTTAIEMVFQWLNDLIEIPEYLEAADTCPPPRPGSLSTLRHLYGLTADLIVNNIRQLNNESNGCDLSDNPIVGIDLMLRQSLLVYIETLNGEYPEPIAKLSCACIRHILLSVVNQFNDNLWQITIDCLAIGHRMTLHSLQTLVNVFQKTGNHFLDDLDQIQVICKRNVNRNHEDSNHLCRLAHQIFLLEAQRGTGSVSGGGVDTWKGVFDGANNSVVGENRSFIFVINSGDNPQT
ncbi:unnamed protein product, partial [Oppiella nova]